MKILQVHNFYKQAGGEDSVLNREKELLLKKGQSVKQFTKNNDEIKGVFKGLYTAITTRFSVKSRNDFDKYLEVNDCDLVHVHNFFPLITPSIFDVTSNKKIPVVLTLHNYRLIHPNGLMLHEGKIDERSIKGSAYQCVKDGVYRGSIIQTAIVANMIEYHRRKGTWKNKVDAFIALTEFAKRKFVEGGLPADKIFVKPNFVENPFTKSLQFDPDHKKKGYLFVGRISEEKGIKDLIDAWINLNPSIQLTIIGDGPLKKVLERKSSANENVNWLGNISNDEVLFWLSKTKAMIFPSKCYEGFPMTILEAMSIGCPVISSNIGSQESIIEDGSTGLHFKAGDSMDLIDKVSLLESNEELADKLGKNARKEYLNNYTPERNYKMIMEIYDEVISKR